MLKRAIEDSAEFLIKSRKSYNKPISREMFNVSCLGTHSMRKTWKYHCYKQTKDMALL
ncbi:hypothetical protein [Paraclostridium sordellii]|uniref:hypothetical protein n=1 Tax=Paraclostridium sordellii TaxID=1505 RepID=UPI0005E8DFF2|nr:hypothetical protein [Paeniclostridium sordellii]CEN78117.1 phage integrase family site specific recombinase [[Clostridium] sordellii] [Paeniclostridium sordellii]